MNKQTTRYIDNQTGEEVRMRITTHQGAPVKNVIIDFGNQKITLEKGCEICISIVHIDQK